MTEKLRTYNADLISCVIGGRPITGFAKDSSIQVERTSEQFTKRTGLKGNTTRSKNPDKSGTITLTLEQTSSDNDYLTGKHELDDKYGTGVFSVMIKDDNGTTLVDAPEAWVSKLAKVDLAVEAGERVWTIDVSDLSVFVGGNYS